MQGLQRGQSGKEEPKSSSVAALLRTSNPVVQPYTDEVVINESNSSFQQQVRRNFLKKKINTKICIFSRRTTSIVPVVDPQIFKSQWLMRTSTVEWEKKRIVILLEETEDL